MRRCLEREAVRRIAGGWQPAMGTTLSAHVDRELAAAATPRPQVSGRLGAEFHILLAELSGNALLERYLSEVVWRCALILAVHGRDHDQSGSVAEHRRLVELLAAGDADGAETSSCSTSSRWRTGRCPPSRTTHSSTSRRCSAATEQVSAVLRAGGRARRRTCSSAGRPGPPPSDRARRSRAGPTRCGVTLTFTPAAATRARTSSAPRPSTVKVTMPDRCGRPCRAR